MSRKNYFRRTGIITLKERFERNGRTRMDIVIQCEDGKEHYLQARPDKFGLVAQLRDSQSATFIFDDEYSCHQGRHYSNFILKDIEQ